MTQRWTQLSARWKVVGGASALLLVMALALPLQMASATTPIPFAAGELRLHMNTDASWFKFFDNSNSQVGGTQSFSAGNKCNYVAGSNGNLLMTPSAPIPPNASRTVVGYLQKDNGYGLGVNTGGKEGTGSCNGTNIGEQFVLELNNDSTTSPVNGMYVDHTALDMEFKFNGILNITYSRDGHAIGSNTRSCGTASDCGPDSGGGDNYVVDLSFTDSNGVLQPWDKVTLTVTSSNSQGSVTLEGGNDAGTSESVFHLVKLMTPITCGTTVNGSGGGTDVNVTLVNDGACVDKGYSLDVSSRSLTLNTASNTGAQDKWIVDVNDWAKEAAKNPLDPTFVIPPAPNGEAVVWCNGSYSEASNDLPANGGTLGASMPTGGHSWCLVRQEVQIAGSGFVQLHEIFLLVADATAFRK
jgi:hypothetical protein